MHDVRHRTVKDKDALISDIIDFVDNIFPMALVITNSSDLSTDLLSGYTAVP